MEEVELDEEEVEDIVVDELGEEEIEAEFEEILEDDELIEEEEEEEDEEDEEEYDYMEGPRMDEKARKLPFWDEEEQGDYELQDDDDPNYTKQKELLEANEARFQEQQKINNFDPIDYMINDMPREERGFSVGRAAVGGL
jgi:hypothetical protein